MKSVKARKMDIISGLTEIEIYYYLNLYDTRNDFFNRITPDIIVSSNINPFKLQIYEVNKNLQKQRYPLTS